MMSAIIGALVGISTVYFLMTAKTLAQKFIEVLILVGPMIISMSFATQGSLLFFAMLGVSFSVMYRHYVNKAERRFNKIKRALIKKHLTIN